MRTVAVGVLLACALVGVLPVGRHARQRAAAAPAFAAAAAFAALYEPGVHLLPAVLGAAGISAAVVAGIGRALSVDGDEVSTVWIVSGLTVFACCAVPAMLGWDARVAWTLLVFLSMMAARFAPSLAVDVPDEALLDLDRLAVTAWSARDSQRQGRRGRIVVAADAMERLVHRASRIVTGAAAAILVTMLVASPLLLHTRDHRPRPHRRPLPGLLRRLLAAPRRPLLPPRGRPGPAAPGRARRARRRWPCTSSPGPARATSTPSSTSSSGWASIALAAAVATGRGWRSVWWSRRAEVAESLCGSFAFASAVVAAGVFRRLWEMTS